MKGVIALRMCGKEKHKHIALTDNIKTLQDIKNRLTIKDFDIVKVD